MAKLARVGICVHVCVEPWGCQHSCSSPPGYSLTSRFLSETLGSNTIWDSSLGPLTAAGPSIW